MSKPKTPDSAKLFLSAIYCDSGLMDDCLGTIMDRLGNAD